MSVWEKKPESGAARFKRDLDMDLEKDDTSDRIGGYIDILPMEEPQIIERWCKELNRITSAEFQRRVILHVTFRDASDAPKLEPLYRALLPRMELIFHVPAKKSE